MTHFGSLQGCREVDDFRSVLSKKPSSAAVVSGSVVSPLDLDVINSARLRTSTSGDNVSCTTPSAKAFTRKVRFDTLHMVQGDGGADSRGLGKAYVMEPVPAWRLGESAAQSHKSIGEVAATAICGNDITASCFYVVGELTKNAGVYAPVCTVLSSLTLYCFRNIYGEVVSALPLNGGIYNLLLNSTSKRTASVAACLTILSYTATGVVSAVSAADYLCSSSLGAGVEVLPMAVGILAFFAALMLLGMKESSLVASILFVFHLTVLFVLGCLSLLYLVEHGLGQFYDNLAWPQQPPFRESVFFGFSAAMLGVSGFETSANFVEEQQEDVFPKTLRNMWVSVSLINIILPALSLMIVPLDDLTGPSSAYALGLLAKRVAGTLYNNVVVVDALLVLSGSVLTSYVGVCGLVQRMAGDRCLPQVFATLNRCRGTPHFTILTFFGICTSMCILLKADITMLGAVYSLSFLLVMGLFAFCGVYMKLKRPTLPRPIVAPAGQFLLGILLVGSAFAAVTMLHPEMLTYFYLYYGITVLTVMLAFARVQIFSTALWVLTMCAPLRTLMACWLQTEPDAIIEVVSDEISRLWCSSVVYFTKSAELSQLNRALMYIEENEEARLVRIVHVYDKEEAIPSLLLECVRVLDCVYPKIRLDCILVPGEFGPAMVAHVSEMTDVAPNCMFINCPKERFGHRIDELGGVRVILNSEKVSILDRMLLSDENSPRRQASIKNSMELLSPCNTSRSEHARLL
eukprot:TRINITY_DN8282_c1_g1_i1.p1 TRINITY_DN8282_c1_g1~~TRINITY_DN8282_c1_g1_i1.p1  ORF type:complete len:744 (-),score=146.53 TRINITY_DN8282_c1_g1_i1:365-2596(-)